METGWEAKLTVSQREQLMVESHVFSIFDHFNQLSKTPHSQFLMLEIATDEHTKYLTNGLQRLPPSFCVLDANRPWLCYWIVHSLAVLGEPIDDKLENNVVEFLNRCQDPLGGYGGGPGQMSHMATTYAAVNSLVTLGGSRALSSIKRDKLYAFLQRMKDSSGSFRMHENGEIDVRACYTAISVASILNILDPELVDGVGDFILSCQTYEGGIAGEPGSEAHGGYTFCGLAAMILINEAHRLDLPALINWVVFRQGVEGGFQGRANKLVDGCYSFWQGGVFPLIQRLHKSIKEQMETMDSSYRDLHLDRSNLEQGVQTDIANLCDIGLDFLKHSADVGLLFHNIALQQYIILCSQVLKGGFQDKPGKNRDFYHTCYCLSGLSVCHYITVKDVDSAPVPQEVLGPYSNLLEPTHPLYNVVLARFYEARDFYSHSKAPS